eukprot:8869808-Ditylum_brightwellii.AAC.1
MSNTRLRCSSTNRRNIQKYGDNISNKSCERTPRQRKNDSKGPPTENTQRTRKKKGAIMGSNT